MDNPQSGKPSSVVVAIYLLWGGIALGIVRLLLDPAALIASNKAMVIAGAFVFALALYAFLIVKISTGRNWARIALLVLVLSDLVLSGPNIVSGFGRAPLGAIVALGGSGVLLCGLVLLFIGPGRTWFSRRAP
jgi:hypothetical protein